MARRNFPQGSIPTDKMRALLACTQGGEASEAADALLVGAGLPRALLGSSPSVGLDSFVQALRAYAKTADQASADAIAKKMHDAPFCGRYAQLLRRCAEPEEALAMGAACLDEPTFRFEQLAAGPGYWAARGVFAHDPALEQSGWLERVRLAEACLVPTLYGFGAGEATLGAGGVVSLRWRLPPPRFAAVAAAGGAAFAFVLSAALQVFAIAALGCLLLAVAAVCMQRRRAVLRAAKTRKLQVLEALLESRELTAQATVGDFEGGVVAGLYRVGARLGSGGNSVVYAATRLADERPVALKLLRAAAAHDATASDRMRREAEALGLAWHPHVVEVLDHGRLPDGTSYLAIELLQGETLARKLTKLGKLQEADAVEVATQLAEALTAMHAAGVIHRDLKPENVFLCAREGAAVFAKILDFGIARVEWEELRITQHDAPLGTPGYMAPEQARAEEVDARADLYALGVMLRECLTGEAPPRDRAAPSMRAQAASELPASPEPHTERTDMSSLTGMSAELRALVLRLIAARREDRPASAREVLHALRELRAGVAASSAPPRLPFS